MRVGFHVGQVVFRGTSLQKQYLDHLEQFRAVRAAGFDYFSWGHHWLIHPFQHFQPVPILARFAAEAGEMELMSMVLLTPLLNPVQTAEEVATLDHICAGRFIFGVGLGYREEECEAAGIEMKDRRARFEEGLSLMKRLWTEQEVTHHGRFYHVSGARPTARTCQQPYPRIWLAAMSDGAVRRAARLGHPFIPSGLQSLAEIRAQLALWREGLAQHGHETPAEIPMFREFYVAASHEEALRRARRSIEAKYTAYVDHGFPGASAQVARGLDELLEDTFIVGSPRECVERLEACAELGVTHLGLRLFWPAMEQAEVLQMIELTAAQVLPALRRLGS